MWALGIYLSYSVGTWAPAGPLWTVFTCAVWAVVRGRAIGGLVADANADADWLGVAERSGRGTRERERVCTVSKGAVSVPIRRVPLDASHLCACRGDRAEAVRAALRSL